MVLSILAGGESYGYEIIQRVRELSGGQMEWSDGMLYPVLHRLEEAGLVVSRWESAETGRQRKYYQLTGAGTAELERLREQWLVVHHSLERLAETAHVGDADV